MLRTQRIINSEDINSKGKDGNKAEPQKRGLLQLGLNMTGEDTRRVKKCADYSSSGMSLAMVW